MRDKIIHLLGLVTGQPHEAAGQYLVSYDPEYHLPDQSYDGGALICTPNRDEATRYTLAEAIMLRRAGPTCTCHRLRPDGKVNAPLSAFNMEFEEDFV